MIIPHEYHAHPAGALMVVNGGTGSYDIENDQVAYDPVFPALSLAYATTVQLFVPLTGQ